MIIKEKEIKYLLAKDDFDILYKTIENKYSKVNSIIQVNYYINTENILLDNIGITARIRKFDSNTYEYTIKKSLKKIKDNIHEKEEITLDIEKEIVEKLVSGVALNNYEELIKPIISKTGEINSIGKLKIIGELTTQRISFIIDKKYSPLLFDISSYLDTYDYEIEWESENIDQYKKILIDTLNDLKISPLNSCDSKNLRFQKRYKQLNNIF